MQVVSTKSQLWMDLSILMQLLDLVTFIPAVMIWGISGEINPIAAFAYANAGEAGVIALKLLGISYIIWALSILSALRSRLIPLAVSLVLLLGTLGTLSNVISIGISL